MIIGYVGTPGSGKSYEAVKTICSNLQKGKVIYTNVEGLEVPQHREVIKTVCNLTDLAIERQLKILEPDQLEDFWNHIEPQCLVVLDEIHKIFSSREWQTEKNKHFGYWASTHRHLGINVILITQDAGRIDTAVRSLFEFTYLFRKVNFLGSAVKKKYICYVYAGDDTSGQLLKKKVETYNQVIFQCYKSYDSQGIKEFSIRQNINILRHPVIYAIPIVFGLTLYMLFNKSSFATGDVFGTKKIMDKYQEQSEAINTAAPVKEIKGFTKSIQIITQENGVKKYTNRKLITGGKSA